MLGDYINSLRVHFHNSPRNTSSPKHSTISILIRAVPPLLMDNESAVKYLELLLNRTLRAHTSDGRMFLGEFKCTDNVLPPGVHVQSY
jgi:hypothetical protein